MGWLVRVAPLACLPLVVAAEPAFAARDACARSDRGDRYQAAARFFDNGRDVVRTAVVVCDRRTGRRSVVHRAFERRGDTIESAAAAGRRVAWIERHRGARPRIEIVVLDMPSRRELRRLTVARGRIRGFHLLDVAVTSRGDLAWQVPAGRRRDRIVVQPLGRRRREIARGRLLSGLGVEDDRTLRWQRGAEEEFVYHDLRAPRVVRGCPRRERFHPRLSDAHVLVTSADYGAPTPIDGTAWSVVRACLRTVGRDFVVAQEEGSTASWYTVALIRPAPPYLVLGRTVSSRYHGCVSASLATVDLRSGRSGHSASLQCDGLPDRAAPAVTASGAPAWIDAPGARLLAIDGLRGLIELDNGVPGSLQGLRTQGDTVHWTHAGQPRAADLQ